MSTQTGPDFTGCCPRFDPAPFQEQQVVWSDELFAKDHVHSLWHVPLGFSKHVTRLNAQIAAASAAPAVPLMLCDESSPWGSELYVLVTKPVPNVVTVKLPGRCLTKVFAGPFRDAPKWARAMQQCVAQRGEQLQKLYFAYTTCPACAKAYGVNYVVLFAKVG